MFGTAIARATAISFRTNDRGETLFFFSGFFLVPQQGYLVTSEEDVAKLKRALSRYHKHSLWLICALVLVATILVDVAGNILLFLLAMFGVGLIYRLAYQRLVFGKMLRGCERAPERMGFFEAQEIRAASWSWKGFRLQALFLLLGAAAVLWVWDGIGTDLKIVGILLVILATLNQAHLYVLKRRQSRDASTPPLS